MPRGGNHPKHPKCPHCNKALYKVMEKGKHSKKDDPFCYCRNENCDFYGVKQDEPLIAEARRKKEEREANEKKEKPKRSKKTVQKSVKVEPVVQALLDCRYDNEWAS